MCRRLFYPGVLETACERFLPRLGAGKAIKAACTRERRLFQLHIRQTVIDIEPARLRGVPGRLREHLDAVVFGIAEIDRPGVGVRNRLGLGVRQLANLFVDAADLVEAVDADATWPMPLPGALASVGISTIW